VAQVAGTLETLLRSGTHWDTARASALQAVVRSFRTTALPVSLGAS
jgi:hypothetical protein